MKDAYLTYVRPLLEYAAIVWSFHTNNSINKLEAVQKRAVRNVAHACIIPYNYNIKTHDSVSCGPRKEAGAPHREYINRKKENAIFTPM